MFIFKWGFRLRIIYFLIGCCAWLMKIMSISRAVCLVRNQSEVLWLSGPIWLAINWRDLHSYYRKLMDKGQMRDLCIMDSWRNAYYGITENTTNTKRLKVTIYYHTQKCMVINDLQIYCNLIQSHTSEFPGFDYEGWLQLLECCSLSLSLPEPFWFLTTTCRHFMGKKYLQNFAVDRMLIVWFSD